MNKNIIIKSIAALTILTSITGVGTTMVEGIQQTAKAENTVKQITNTNVAPYSGVTWMALEQDLWLEIIQSLPINMLPIT